MNKLLIASVFLMLAGCISVSGEEVIFDESAATSPEAVRRFISLRQVHNGMTSQEVASVLNDKVVVGYELVDMESGQYKPITLDNPYRKETIQKGPKSYHVEYYLEKTNVQDGIIADDELVPLVFRDDSLIGKGWDFLKKKIKN